MRTLKCRLFSISKFIMKDDFKDEVFLSEIKTDEEGFNSLASRKELEQMLADTIKSGIWRAVDISMESGDFWSNGCDTLVLMFSINSGFTAGLEVADFVKRCGADEYSYQEAVFQGKRKVVVRLWWD